MKKKIIFITIESVKRELDSKILLALKALKKNYRVVIGQKSGLYSAIKYFNSGIVILKSFGPRNTSQIDFLKQNGFKLVSNDEELILAMDFQDKIDTRMNNENLKKLDLLLAVGEKSDYPVIKKNLNILMKNVFISGNIRLELLKKKYRKLLEKDSFDIKKKFGNYILLLTGFARINKFRENFQIDYTYNRIVEANIDPESYHIYLAEQQIRMQRESLLQTLKFLDNFEKNFPDKKILISPHPNERLDFWRNYIKKRKFKNIFLNSDMLSASYPIINSCELLITTNSTSILEAFFLEKKSINLLGKESRPSEIELLKRISKVVRSHEELIETVKDLGNNENQHQTNEELKEVKNYKTDFDSFDNLLQRLSELEGVNTFDNLFKKNKYGIYLNFINKYKMFKQFIKQIIKYKNNKKKMLKRFHAEKVGKRLQYDNYVKRVKHFNSYENINNLKIKQILPEVFLLDKIE